MTFTLKHIIDYGALIIIFYVFVNNIIIQMRNNNKKQDTENEMNNSRNFEMFKLIKTQVEQITEMNRFYQEEMRDLKKIILNSSNMNIEDFCTFITFVHQNSFLNLEKEMVNIINRNHIDSSSIDITNRKVENLIETIINNNVKKINELNFDSNIIKEIVDFNINEKNIIKISMKDVVSNYAGTNDPHRNETAKRQIEENIKYVSNAFDSQLYAILKKFV